MVCCARSRAPSRCAFGCVVLGSQAGPSFYLPPTLLRSRRGRPESIRLDHWIWAIPLYPTSLSSTHIH